MLRNRTDWQGREQKVSLASPGIGLPTLHEKILDPNAIVRTTPSGYGNILRVENLLAPLFPTNINVLLSLPMPLLCPICKFPAQELPRTGDATGFYCTVHGHFKVADTISLDDWYTRAEWEAALRSAKYKAMEGEWPVIRQGDFLREREISA